MYLFGRTNDNKDYIKTTDFMSYFYIPDNNGEYNSILNEKLSKIFCKQKEINILKEKYNITFEADIGCNNRYIIDEIKVLNKEPIRLCYIDIETLQLKGYSSVEEAQNPIVCIGCYDSFDKQIVQFSNKNEKILLNDFIEYISKTNPDILIAWNGDEFDFPYILNRMRNLKIDSRKLSRLNKNSYVSKYGVHIFGRVTFDLLKAYKKHFAQGGRESYSLEYISKYELKDLGGKEKYSGTLDELYKNDFEKFLIYNKKDIELMILLNEKLNIINFFDEIRRLCFCKFEDVFMNSKVADCLCLKYAKENNVVLPSINRNLDDETFEGAFCHTSEPKLHRTTAVFDMQSLYPSIIIGFNISYETLLKEKTDNSINIDDKYFFKQEIGMIPSILKPMLDKRKEVRILMNTLDRNTDEYKHLYLQQFALKVIANSFYGYLGFKNSRIYNINIAGSVTYTARKIIQEIISWFENKEFSVIYGDTDSVFVLTEDKSIEQMIELNDEINLYFKEYFKQYNIDEKNNIFKLQFEKVFKTIFFKQKSDGTGAKKKYAGRIIWQEGKVVDKLSITGFESKRSDSPQVGRDFLEKILRMIVYENKEEEINKFIEDFKFKIRSGVISPEDLGIPISITKDLNKYANQIHAKASRISNIKHNMNILSGDKIKYLFVLEPEKVIAFKTKFPEGYHIDYENIIRRIINLKVEPLFRSLGWDYEIPGKVKQIKTKQISEQNFDNRQKKLF